jgi:hypothetical protein
VSFLDVRFNGRRGFFAQRVFPDSLEKLLHVHRLLHYAFDDLAE